ncbi:MAG TPA: hypothetical protein VK050_09190 [Flavobacteriaceae bacterium]|nr:hypothetical protein [Flavobacteriaceae bacterium]
MKRGIILFCSVVVALLGYSCSSDDNSPEEISLVGEWQLEKADFSHIEDHGAPYYSDFCIIEYISGYTFNADGTAIVMVVNDMFGTNSGVNGKGEPIWYWTGDINDFTIDQPNPGDTNGLGFTPNDITNRKISKVDGKWTLTFDTNLALGSSATFTLVKKDIDVTQRPELLENGAFKEPCKLLDR